MIFGLFSIADQCAGFILSFIPFYYVLKVGSLIWLFHPATEGATYVYYNYVQPTWKQYESQIDAAQREFESSVGESVDKIREKAGLGKKIWRKE